MNIKSIVLIFLFFLSINTFSQNTTDFYAKLSKEAIELTKIKVKYDPKYVTLAYPNGDVPPNTGVCTDVVIRAYRKLGIDLQKEVHEDMKANFGKYPSRKKWGLKGTDKNIDHRRVLNLEVFFTRKGTSLPISSNGDDYQTGDLVSWTLPGNLPHIGIVTDKKSPDGKRPLIVHNIGGGQVLEDMLFDFKLVGHFRYSK